MLKRALISVMSLVLLTSSVAIPQSVVATGDANIVRVTTTEELKEALANAQAGDEIVVAEGDYVYRGSSTKGYTFHGAADGTKEKPIIIRSENPEKPAVLQCSDTGSKNVFTVTGDWWEIRNLKMTNASKGIVLDNSNHTKIIGCEVYNLGQEAIHIRDNSSYCLVENCYVHDTGVLRPGFGEAVYVGSAKGTTDYGFDCHYNTIRGCTLGPNVTAEHVDVKEYTIGTIIENCTFNGTGISGENYAKSFVNIKGNDCILRNNTGYRNGCEFVTRAFEQNTVVDGWGQNAYVYGNKVYMDTATNANDGKMYFLNAWNCTVTVWDNFMAYEDDLFSVDNESDHWNYYNCNMLTYGTGNEIEDPQPTAEVKYQLRPNDETELTDIRFILVADEQVVINADSASVYATISEVGDTATVILKRAYRSIKAGGQTIIADSGKVFLICKFVGIPDDLLDGITVHFTLGENTYNRTIEFELSEKKSIAETKIAFVGDSITWGYNDNVAEQVDNPYPKIIKEKYGFAECYNLGISGRTLGGDGNTHDGKKIGSNSVISMLDTIPDDSDIIVVFAGTNDFGVENYYVPLGIYDDTTNLTYYGSLRTLCESLKEYSNKKVFFVTSLHRKAERKTDNGVERYLSDYVNASREVCADYGIEVIDLYENGEFNASDEAFRQQYSISGLHPNQYWYYILAEKIGDYIVDYINNNY